MAEPPVEAVRSKPDSSIAVMAELARERGDLVSFVAGLVQEHQAGATDPSAKDPSS